MINAHKRSDVFVAVQRAKFPIAIKSTSRLGEHKLVPVLVKEHGFDIEGTVARPNTLQNRLAARMSFFLRLTG